ncbi:SOS response-associated peptidase family protein [Alteromonas sp. 009811495]|uniref:SOS response-associated peptidase family protein n=1 Tax=Alteromonas sp. 009811495 TaxID=3002962 RepID=UPI00237EE632|nr:SOS response-associated peptidase family protein [Alteromonas sp. 009811495]WDT87962.1 SOS response-associated peptidase family protein [Alteromonas sp. 009811495]
MCGFIQRVTDSPAVIALLEEVGLQQTIPFFENEKTDGNVINFYPAFGKIASKRITNLIVSPSKTIDATWWFDAKPQGQELELGERTTFNARNIDSPFWKKAITHRRGVVVATAIGESNPSSTGKGKSHYLIEPKNGAFLLGAVYRIFSNGLYSCAVITRPPVEGFSQFHEKSIPCFLPHNKSVIEAWLHGDANYEVEQLLVTPKIYTDLKVTSVKTFKGAEPLGESIPLSAS